MIAFRMVDFFGSFLADGLRSNEFRATKVEPVWSAHDRIVFDFDGVTNMTDSFAFGCFTNLAEEHRDDFLAKVRLKNCDPLIRALLSNAVAMGLQSPRQHA